jgi:hypothetical protein
VRSEDAAERGTEREGAVHRDADPGHDEAGALAADERDAPAQRSGDDEALAEAEERTAEEEHAEARERARLDERRRAGLHEARERRDDETERRGGARAAAIAARPGGVSREQRRPGLRTDDETDDERAEAERVVHV